MLSEIERLDILKAKVGELLAEQKLNLASQKAEYDDWRTAQIEKVVSLKSDIAKSEGLLKQASDRLETEKNAKEYHLRGGYNSQSAYARLAKEEVDGDCSNLSKNVPSAVSTQGCPKGTLSARAYIAEAER